MRRSELDLSAYSPRDRFPFLEAATSRWAALQPIHGDLDFSARWRMWELDRIVLSDAQCAPARFERRSRRHLPHDNEFVLIQLYLEGHSDVRIDDEAIRTKTGSFYLLDKSRRFSSVSYGARTLGLVIPHDVIGYDPSRHPAIIETPQTSPYWRVLARLLTTLPSRLETATSTDVVPLARAVADVFGTMLGGPSAPVDADAVRCARRIAIENYVEVRLKDPELDVSSICAAFGLSRATLYRHFPNQGGVAGFIRQRRLIAAFADLKSMGGARGAVREVCDRWGFYDTPHFRRAFKRQFEASPVELDKLPPLHHTEQVTPGDLLGGWHKRRRRS